MKTTHKTLRSVVVFMAVIGMMFGVFASGMGAQVSRDVVTLENQPWTCENVVFTGEGGFLYGRTDYFSAGKLDVNTDPDKGEVTSLSGRLGPIEYTLSSDFTTLSFKADPGIGVIVAIVKGGPTANAYLYTPYATADSGLVSPNNPAGIPEISNFSFCYIELEEEMGQWCSPGYWRQEHHLDSWPMNIDPDDMFSVYFPDYRTDVMTGVSLWDVLQNPQMYQGKNMDAFNMVGDLLSEHTLDNYDSSRPDNCPLD
jgi:hypothetical protein